MNEDKSRLNHVIFGILAGAIVSCLFFFSSCINIESAVTLAIFNFLFVFLIFPFPGTLKRKFCILAIGNVIGFIWNYTFFLFVAVSAICFGEFLNILYIILNPFLNALWIVSFWSMSLTFITAHT